MSKPVTLKRSLGCFRLWGIAVGLVISGEYFGWSYGWASAGTLGFMIVVLAVALMYCFFIFGFSELTTSIPQAGGPFIYAYRAFGPSIGFIAGFATLTEFVFAPPAIAMAIGAYINVQFPHINQKWIAITAYLIFMGLNFIGVGIAASFELIVTLLAIFELFIFMGVVQPGFHWHNFIHHGWAGQNHFHLTALSGMFASIPFAIWFFLAIEGASMAAEETKDPQRTIPKALGSGIITLTLLAIFVMLFAGGVGNWKTLANINDPLPQAMKVIVGQNSGWLHMLVWLGIFGLISSLHGIIMGYSRQIFALARAGYLPCFLSHIHPITKTPHWAILSGGLVGILAICSDSWITIHNQPLTANLVTLSVLGALIMYLISMASLFQLRRKEPSLDRPFKAVLYPFAPIFVMAVSSLCLIAIIWYNLELTLIFITLIEISYFGFQLVNLLKINKEQVETHSS